MQTSRGSRSGILSKSEQLDRCGFIFVTIEPRFFLLLLSIYVAGGFLPSLWQCGVFAYMRFHCERLWRSNGKNTKIAWLSH
jgi:hypothetical protein